ncbi:MAG: ATP-binding protein [Pseudomonadota bacterium]
MRGWLGAFFNSISARVMALLLGATLVATISIILVMQTPLAGRIFDEVLKDNASNIAELTTRIEDAPPELEEFILTAYSGEWRVARVEPAFKATLTSDAAKAGLLTGGDEAGTNPLAGRDIRFRTFAVWEMTRHYAFKQDGPPVIAASAQQVAIELEDGRVLSIWLTPLVSLATLPFAVFSVSAILLAIMIVVGVAISWIITGPIKKLEREAELVGLSQTAVPISENGPRELRQMSGALNRMRSRLSGLIREREEIVVALAHDIRTGITRLKLRMEDHLGDDAEAYEADLALMEQLVTDMLTYARAESPLVDPELITLSEFLTDMIEASPFAVELIDDEASHAFTIAGSALALHRLFENLIENARRYGRGHLAIRLHDDRDGFWVSVEDEGPGMSEEERAQAFQPFFRGEGSRNRETGGSGLGLGIARAIATTHGAQITLANREQGGLAATVFFPRQLAT